MIFKHGKSGSSIVVDEPIDNSHGGVGHDHVRWYGGYLVAESIHPEVKPLFLDAYNLLTELEETADVLVDLANYHLPLDHPDHTLAITQAQKAYELVNRIKESWPAEND